MFISQEYTIPIVYSYYFLKESNMNVPTILTAIYSGLITIGILVIIGYLAISNKIIRETSKMTSGLGLLIMDYVKRLHELEERVDIIESKMNGDKLQWPIKSSIT